MGGVVAVQVALQRLDLVRRLVLAATSGGIDLAPFGVADWRRPTARASRPRPPGSWRLASISPTALGPSKLRPCSSRPRADAISPPSVGAHLATLLPDATLVVVPGGDRAFARDRADEVAPHIERHLDR